MSLSELASLGSFVSGFAVLVSIVYLALQVRQAARNQRALMQQGRADRVSANCLALAVSDLSRIYAHGTAGDETLSEDELYRYMLICRTAFVSAEDSFLQYLSGALDDNAFNSFDVGLRTYFGMPGVRAAWRIAAQEYGDKYRDYVNTVLAETKVATPGISIGQWKMALTADR